MICRASRLLLVVCALMGAPAHAEDAPQPPRTAMDVARALGQVEDDGSIVALAELPGIDPFLVAEHVFVLHTDALVEDGGDEALWRALERYAQAVKDHPAGRGLPALVAAWHAAGAEGHRAEQALRRVLGQTTDRIKQRQHAEVVRMVDEALAKPPPAASLAAPQLRVRKAASMNTLRQGDARPLVQAVLDEARTRQWLTLEALALHVLTNAHHVALDIRSALTSAQGELSVREKLGDVKRTGLARANLAMLTWRAGDRVSAVQIGKQAVDELEAAGHQRAVLQLLTQLSTYRRDLGDATRALAMLDDVLARSAAPALFPFHAEALMRRASVLVVLGRLAEARGGIDRLLGDPRLARPGRLRARVLKERAAIDFSSGRIHDAEAGAREALGIFVATNDRQFAMEARIMLAHVLAALRRYEEAMALYRTQGKLAMDAGDPHTARWVEVNIAWCLSQLGRLQESIALAESVRATAVRSRAGRLQALALRAIASAYRKMGRNTEARDALRRALELLGDFEEHDSMTTTEIRDQLAVILLEQGDHAEASALARDSAMRLLRRRQGFGERELSRILHSTSFSAFVGIEAEVARARDLPEAKRDAAWRSVLWFGEAQRALVLADSILNAGAYRAAAAPDRLLAAEDRARQAVGRLQQALLRTIAAKDVDAATIVELRAKLGAARQELDRHAAAVERAVQREAALSRTPLATVEEIRAWLPADTALLVYLRGKDQVYACALTDGALSVADVGAGENVFGAVRRYLDLVSTPTGAEEKMSRALYDRLVRPVAEHLTGCRRVVVCPTGPLNFVPFEALRMTDTEGADQRVIHRWEISYAPSATVLGLLLRDAARGRGVIALGDPTYPAETSAGPLAARGLASLRRLVASGEEVRAIASLFGEEPKTVLLRENASLPALSEALAGASGRVRAVHLACHGFVDTEHPRLSGLVLAGGAVLSVESLYRMRVDADLAVLSACDSGRGQAMRGEGVIGMTRGFFRAGVPRVVVSSWKVSDASTRDLMTGFYRAHVRDQKPASAALRAAKLQMLASEAHRHPFHWAAFQIWGRYD